VEQSSARAIINWQGFDVAAGETVVFAQPSASAITLNRVAGASASNIAGNISANGRIFIVNPNGVVFGATASVNTAGLVATSANIDDASFMQGRYEFRTPGSDNAQISNQGLITTSDGGRVALLGPHVENTGTIAANGGVVVLATGQIFLVDLFGDGLVQVASARVQGPPFGDIVHNIGDIRVGSGTVLVRSLPQFLQGSVNLVNVADLASRAVILPGGAVAFVGSAAGSLHSAYPAWLGPALVSVGPMLHGAGIIDATPTYSFQAPGNTVAGAANTAPTNLARLTEVGLTEFNRLPDSATESTAYGAENAGGRTLYRVAARRQPIRNAKPVAASDESSPAPVPQRAKSAQQAAYGKRFCTVTEVMHAVSAQGCR
jgi:filamentous hemagglutinin family protein